LAVERLGADVVSTESSVGIRHLTVVPTNFDPPGEDATDGRERAGAPPGVDGDDASQRDRARDEDPEQ